MVRRRSIRPKFSTYPYFSRSTFLAESSKDSFTADPSHLSIFTGLSSIFRLSSKLLWLPPAPQLATASPTTATTASPALSSCRCHPACLCVSLPSYLSPFHHLNRVFCKAKIFNFDLPFFFFFYGSRFSHVRTLSATLDHEVFAYECLIATMPLVEKAFLPSLHHFCTLTKNQLGVFVWGYYFILSSLPLTCVCPSPKLFSLDYCNYIISPKTG